MLIFVLERDRHVGYGLTANLVAFGASDVCLDVQNACGKPSCSIDRICGNSRHAVFVSVLRSMVRRSASCRFLYQQPGDQIKNSGFVKRPMQASVSGDIGQ